MDGRQHELPDIQAEPDLRNIPIDQVGVRNLRWPMTVLDRAEGHRETIADVSLSVNLPHTDRGTHMSRIIEVLNEYRNRNWTEHLGEILRSIRSALNAGSARIDAEFDYFIEKEAPVSGVKSLMSYRAGFHATYNDGENFIISVRVPVMTLCPCSKEIADEGAHNQRCEVTVQVRYTEFVWLEELIEMVEASASGGLYSVLKRPDEKHVTEHAYAHPAFVEDVVREVAIKLDADNRITWYDIEAESMESIHNHNAYARLEREKR